MIEVLNALLAVICSDPVSGYLILLALGTFTVIKLVQLYRQEPKQVVDMNGFALEPGMEVFVHHTDGTVPATVVDVFPDNPTCNAPGHWVDIDGGGGPEGKPSYILEAAPSNRPRDFRGVSLEAGRRVLVYGCAGTNREGVYSGNTHQNQTYLGNGQYSDETELVLEIHFPNGDIELQSFGDVEALPPALNFSELSVANRRRCDEDFTTCDEWTLGDWGNALAGEAGEACNIIKKIRRGDINVSYTDLAKELADVVHYADLIASEIGINLGEAVRNKFNEVSDRVGSTIKL